MNSIEHFADSDYHQGYDLIGDVHGCYQTLCKLLKKMDYRVTDGVWKHPERQAVFVGDIVDRGPSIRKTLDIVRHMLESGSARMVMGNHEYNLLCLMTPSDQHDRDFLLPHTQQNLRRIKETLDQFSLCMDELESHLSWIKKLPLFLSFRNFRVVHACWDQHMIDQFYHKYQSNQIDQLLIPSVKVGSFICRFSDRLLRGIDFPLPDGVTIVGRDGIERNVFRSKFWLKAPCSYNELSFQPDPLPAEVAKQYPKPSEYLRLPFYDNHQLPLFFGHYWRTGTPRPVTSNIACLDYSAVKGGKLVCYRMDNEKTLTPEKFVWVECSDS